MCHTISTAQELEKWDTSLDFITAVENMAENIYEGRVSLIILAKINGDSGTPHFPYPGPWVIAGRRLAIGHQ